MAMPHDALAAVTHDDPYPYYAGLTAQRPLHRDHGLGLWVAAGADAVTAVLNSDLCRVRPPDEPVPAALQGTAAGTIFGHLVRMNDGAGHCRFKPVLTAAVASLGAEVAPQAARWVRLLIGEVAGADLARCANAVAEGLSARVIAGLLGVPDHRVDDVAQWIGDFVRAIAPGADAARLASGNVAASHLLALFHDMLAASDDGLLTALARAVGGAGGAAAAAIVANGIGLMSQAHDASAGLIGNTLLALARHHGLQPLVARDPGQLAAVVQEVLRHDSPVQNTRRFVAADGRVAGQAMNAGEVVLVVLAAANRDPAANPRPDRFDVGRASRRCFTFGDGVHACPGERLAVTIAQAAVAHLLAAGLDAGQLRLLGYRPSLNSRIPILGADADG